MKLKLEGICRGEGYIYAKVSLADVESAGEVAFEVANRDGQPLPCRWRDWDEASAEGAGRSFVVIMPLLEKGSQTITATVGTGDGGDGGAQSASARVSMERAKWESRVNYRLRRGLAQRLRGAEKADMFEQINFWVEHALVVGEEGVTVVHGGTFYLAREGVELDYTFFSEDGTKLDVEPILMGKEARPYRSEDYIATESVSWSLRIPEQVKSFTVMAADRNDPGFRGFMTFDSGMFGQALAIGWAMYDNAGVDAHYHEWFLEHRVEPGVLERQRLVSFEHGVLFSIVVPLYRTPIALFREMVDSVIAQSYANWELVLVNASPEDGELARVVEGYRARDGRIRCVSVESNRGIVGNTNIGIGEVSGDYVCFLDHDDLLEPDVLFEYARAIEERPACGMLYCDEDKLLADGTFSNPFFKTDFNIDLLRCHNYICHFLCVKKALLDEVGLSEERHNGAQDHDIALKCSERTSEIAHVKKVLYHWRVVEGSTASADQSENNPKSYANAAGAVAVREHLERLGIDAEVEPTQWSYTHHVRYAVSGEPLVSIIIPNKDSADMLDGCIRSILEKTTYGNYEVVVVENNSVEGATFDYYERAQREDGRVRVVTWPGEFNFSKIVNFGAREARGDFLLFLNNDTMVIEPAWLDCMLGVCQRDDVGVVGAKLLYRDGTMQHAGVVLSSMQEVAAHVYAKMPESNYFGYFLQAGLTMDYSAVTGACLLTKRSAFDEVGGFDETLTVAFNDIDYCLKVRQEGLLVVYEPAARLYHFESISRGYDSATVGKRARFARESGIMHERWAQVYVEGDPFFNPNLQSGYHRLRRG